MTYFRDTKAFRAVREQFMKAGFLYRPYHKLLKYIGQQKSNRINRRRNRDFLRYGRTMLNDVCLAVAQLDTEIFCDYGTLLGLVRGGDLIPHDLDLDMGIVPDERFSWEELERVLGTIGLVKSRQFSLEGRITEQTYDRDGVSIDFFLHDIVGDQMVVYSYFQDPDVAYPNRKTYSVNEYKTRIIHGTQMREINGMHVLIPENSEEFLEDAYGSDWRIPNPNHRYNQNVEYGVPGKFGTFDM